MLEWPIRRCTTLAGSSNPPSAFRSMHYETRDDVALAVREYEIEFTLHPLPNWACRSCGTCRPAGGRAAPLLRPARRRIGLLVNPTHHSPVRRAVAHVVIVFGPLARGMAFVSRRSPKGNSIKRCASSHLISPKVGLATPPKILRTILCTTRCGRRSSCLDQRKNLSNAR